MKFYQKWKKIYIALVVRWRKFYKRNRNDFKDIEVELYDLNLKLRPFFRGLSIILMILAFVSLIAFTGFNLPDYYRNLNNYLDILIVAGFSILFLGRLFFTSQRFDLIKSHILEAILLALLLLVTVLYAIGVEGVLTFFGSFLGVEKTFQVLVGLTKIYLVLIVIAKLIQATPVLLKLQRHPAQVVVGSFLMIVLAGAFLLMMPRATVNGEGLSFINALFTSTSAVCVTGLIVVDTATHFTVLGQVIILVLIQLGGIGIITFATIFALFVSSGLGIGQMMFLKGVLNEDLAQETFTTIKRIVGLTFFIEAIGVIGYYLSWTTLIPDAGERLYYSIFHAVSAFCNAGFSIFTNGLTGNTLNIGVNITTIVMIILGGLGFTTIWELVRGNPRRRTRHRKLSIHTQLVLVVTAFLIISGTIAFLVLEWNNVLEGYEVGEKLLISAFQSITTRTAGFNTVDIGALNTGTAVIFLTLMVIGGSPASTAGGVKTTTVAVLLLSALATVRGQNQVEFSKKTIPMTTIFTALTAFTLVAVSLFTFTLLLTITEDLPFMDLLFEEFSAFATVGLSRGITSSLSDAGKSIIITSMFIGRVGIVTLALAFAKRIDKKRYKYPQEGVIVA